MPAPGGLYPDVVVLTGQVLAVAHHGLAGRALPVLSVKVERVCGQSLRVGAVVDVEIERVHFAPPLVRHCDSGVAREGHGEEGIQRLVRAYGQRNGLIEEIIAQALPEEIADGRFDARRRLAVPVHAQDQFLQVEKFRAGNGDPDVRNDAGPVLVEQRECFAGGNPAIVLIASRAVVAGRALLDVILGFGKARQHAALFPRILSQCGCGYSQNGQKKNRFSHVRLLQEQRRVASDE